MVVRKYLKLEKNDTSYNIYFENGIFLGEFIIKEDGYYDFWPEHPSKDGYWSSYVLREIANTLDELNAPYEKELNEYFNSR